MKKKWLTSKNGLEKTFTFKNFSEALAFVIRVGLESEKENHHPDILIQWNKVHLTLISHDAGDKITNKDLKLAEEIDALLKK
ncbi:MAG: 4a-hydroxytetrahydrobiopterin dehydratase [Verrucomicrobiota bacterium]